MNEPMTKEEALLIDYETTFSLFRIRELRLKGQKPGPIEEKLESEFAWELGNVRAEEKGYEGVVDDIPLRSPTMSPGPPVCETRPPTPSRPPSSSCSKPSALPQEWSIAEEPQPMLGSGSFGWGFGSAPVPEPSAPHEPPSSWAFDSASAGGKNRKSSKKR
ncbi:hypothetical protein NLJ89_g12341 [Agrocybe chaxingu]|uniref:Uncharacterized protein n=1 Tax=Agrocybe chaxingu TaxID=84603 RepID=A0A9W8MQB1_9AGAR|nr:hypothetical protein NLJ89_g12341 [Agrocybe chaxingu]